MTAHSPNQVQLLKFDFDGFYTYPKVPQNKNTDTAKEIIRDVKVYLSSVQVTDESDKKPLKTHERTGKISK